MRKILFLTAALLFAVSVPVFAANVAGTWTLTMAGPQGEETFDLAIKANGDKLDITTTHPKLGEMVGTGTLNGNDITMDIKATGQMAVELVFEGKVTGNKMAGTREIKMASGGGPGGAPGGAPPSGGPGGAPPSGGPGGGGNMSSISNAWSAVQK